LPASATVEHERDESKHERDEYKKLYMLLREEASG
jgi:hypothetical protein